MYHYFLGPRGLQGIHMNTLKSKNSKLITFTVRGGFFTFWAILAHSAARQQNKNVAENWSVYCIAIKGQKELFCGAKLHMYIRSIQLLKVVGILELGI